MKAAVMFMRVIIFDPAGESRGPKMAVPMRTTSRFCNRRPEVRAGAHGQGIQPKALFVQNKHLACFANHRAGARPLSAGGMYMRPRSRSLQVRTAASSRIPMLHAALAGLATDEAAGTH
jgi:hypothetical protein